MSEPLYLDPSFHANVVPLPGTLIRTATAPTTAPSLLSRCAVEAASLKALLLVTDLARPVLPLGSVTPLF
ncbi:MAG: hypothetical protein AAGG69_08170 [Pseudomonadota bacterium]